MREIEIIVPAEETAGVIKVDGVEYPFKFDGLKKEAQRDLFEVELENFYKLKITHPIGWGAWYLDTTPPVPEQLIPLPGEEGGEFFHLDKLLHRSRQPRYIIACRNHIFEFKGRDIPGVCIIEGKSSTANGKWSSVSYSLRLARGFRGIRLEPGFESGRIVNDVTSIKKISEQLGCSDVFPKAVEEYLKREMYRNFVRYNEYLAKLDEMDDFENREGGEFIPYEYEQKTVAKRQGERKLLVNNLLFEGVETPEIKIIDKTHTSGYRGGVTYWSLMIHSSATIEELTEYDPYGGDDSLELRGWSLTGGKWQPPTGEIRESESPNPDSPFAALNGLFG